MNNLPFSSLDRRSFVKLTLMTGGGLVLGLRRLGAQLATGASFQPNPFIQIRPDGSVTLFAKNPESGQGISTTLPMLIAEELEVDFRTVNVLQAPLDPAMGNNQGVGGSQSVPSNQKLMREAGATARQMLIAAAAAAWSVTPDQCRAEMGKVIHSSGKSRTYGELAESASKMPVPDPKEIKLKEPSQFKIIGKWTPGVDNPKIVTGKPLFGMDFKLPGMLYAVYAKCPTFGGKPKGANLDEVKKLPGVRDAFLIDGSSTNPAGMRPGVAIVAESTWHALNARRQLKVDWDLGDGANQSWEGYKQQAAALSKQPATKLLKASGDVETAFQSAPKKLEAAYSYPFIAHCPMEPENCTVSIENGKMSVWVGTQEPRGAAGSAGNGAKIKSQGISLQVMRAGGGFGRRINNNYVSEAGAIAAKVNAPIKLVWDRTDDLQGSPYRAGGFHFLRGAVDDQGKAVAWHNHFVSFGANNTERAGEFADLPPDAFPARSIPNFKSEQTLISTCLPMSSWRAPGVGAYTFVMQSFIDELAYLAGKDPVQFRLEGLENISQKNQITQAAKLSGWGSPLPKGKGRGISFGASSVQVAEVTVDKGGTLTVNKITVVANTGMLVNPSGALAQIEGCVMDGLSATWFQALSIEKGQVMESNFHDYPLTRINQAPEIEIHINSGNGFSGMGEPYLPATAAAITNAIFAATGKRIRDLPIRKADLAWS